MVNMKEHFFGFIKIDICVYSLHVHGPSQHGLVVVLVLVGVILVLTSEMTNSTSASSGTTSALLKLY